MLPVQPSAKDVRTSGDRPARSILRQPLVVYFMAVVLGIFLDRFVFGCAYGWFGMSASCWFARWLPAVGRRRSVSLLLLLLSALGTAAAWHHDRWFLFGRHELARFANPGELTPVCVEVTALEYPTCIPAEEQQVFHTLPRGDRSRFRVRGEFLRDRRSWRPVSGVCFLTVEGHLPGIHAGDRLRVFGYLHRIPRPRNPGEPDLASVARARRHLCSLRANYPDCVCRVTEGNWRLGRCFRDVRSHFDNVLAKNLPPKHRGLAAAVILGIRDRLTTEQREAFLKTGTAHLLSISGLHVGILAGGLFCAARQRLLPVVFSAIGIMVLVAMYAIVTDARAPVVRATILVQVVCWSWLVRRRPDAFNSLACAAILVLAINPCDLFRTGTQLSFIAVGSLVWIGPRLSPGTPQDPLERLIWRSRSWPRRLGRWLGRRIWQLTVVSFAIWLMTLPLVTFHFHLLSPIAIPLNVVSWLPIATTLYSGVGVLVADTFVPAAAPWFGCWCEASLQVLQWSIQRAEAFPGAYCWVPGLGFLGTMFFYAAVMGWLCFPVCVPRRWVVAVGLVWFAASTTDSLGIVRRSGELHVTFLAVGHGTCVVLELPGGATWLYDCGRLGDPRPAVDSVSRYLWFRRIRRLDAVILSHADGDHYNLLPGLIERMSVQRVFVGPGMFTMQSESLIGLRTELDRGGVPVTSIQRGDQLQTGNSALRAIVLHPPLAGIDGSDNANSIVLAVWFSGTIVLLPGDLEHAGMVELLAHRPLDCDIVMAPHHGSPNSQPRAFANWSTPNEVVISGGDVTKAHEVICVFRQFDTRVFHTQRDGAVRFSISRSGCRPTVVGP